jgi:hypothetical protein
MVELLMAEVVQPTWGGCQHPAWPWRRQVVETELDTTLERHISMVVVMEVGYVVVMAVLELG